MFSLVQSDPCWTRLNNYLQASDCLVSTTHAMTSKPPGWLFSEDHTFISPSSHLCASGFCVSRWPSVCNADSHALTPYRCAWLELGGIQDLPAVVGPRIPNLVSYLKTCVCSVSHVYGRVYWVYHCFSLDHFWKLFIALVMAVSANRALRWEVVTRRKGTAGLVLLPQ